MGNIQQQSTSFPCVLINWKFSAEKAGNGISNTLNLKLFCEGACPNLSNRPSLVEGGRGRVAIPKEKKTKKGNPDTQVSMPPDPPYGWIAFGASIFFPLAYTFTLRPGYLQFSQNDL